MLKAVVFLTLWSTVLCSSIVLDSNDVYNVTWEYSDNDITFTVSVATSGWIGLGFSPSGAMGGSDIIIGWVDSTGTGHIKDYSASSNSLPTLDSSQDVTLLSSSENNGVTTMSFKRNLDTADSTSDNVITTDTTRLIWAYGAADPTNNVLTGGDYHTANRGVKSIYLLDPVTVAITLPADSITHEFREHNVTIPHSADTTYWCSWHAAPSVTSKHHVMKVSPIITPGNEAYVHHMIVYGCHGVTQSDIDADGGASHVCYSQEMPDFAGKCSAVIFTWAIGGTDFYYPEVAGVPLGPGTTAPDYYLLETHYDNPNLNQGVVDSSGIVITYSPTLRQYDVGNLEVGSVGGLVIPPGDDAYIVNGLCHGDCTQQGLPSEGITVFAYLLHAHLLGSAIRLEHSRNGNILDSNFAVDNHYDFNYQENRLYTSYKKINPGDTLEVQCTMKSTDRSSITYGGLSTTEEMCLAFLYYYPATNLTQCQSYPDYIFNKDADFYKVLNVTAQQQRNFVDISGALSSVTWNQANLDTAEEASLKASYAQGCLGYGESMHSAHLSQIYSVQRNSDSSTPTTTSQQVEQQNSATRVYMTGMILVMLLTAPSLAC